ncbi:hypothetical protein FQN54_002913 [Arachnomyces sp. PD_36]|nr:hypothetical protein FQN54_002913 [Arachnomyces sp. PD_36]
MTGKVVSEEEWVAARKALLVKEKELKRQSDQLKAEIRDLPMREVTKSYTLKSHTGKELSLVDCFEGRKQLIVYHMMFSPDAETSCSACAFIADHFPHLSHLKSRETNFIAVSRAPAEKLKKFQDRMGWDFDWLSSYGSEFNYDFHVTQDEAVRPVQYNYMDKETLEKRGLAPNTSGEQTGFSVFTRDGDRVYHTYSSFARGIEQLTTTYTLLDLTPLGRQETGPWGLMGFRFHDTYGDDGPAKKCGGCCKS